MSDSEKAVFNKPLSPEKVDEVVLGQGSKWECTVTRSYPNPVPEANLFCALIEEIENLKKEIKSFRRKLNMSDQSLRDKLASEYSHKQNGVTFIYTITDFAAGWDAARANLLTQTIDLNAQGLEATVRGTVDQLRAEVERLSAENKHLRSKVLNPLAVNDMDENIRLKAQCEKLAEALIFAHTILTLTHPQLCEVEMNPLTTTQYMIWSRSEHSQALAAYRKEIK